MFSVIGGLRGDVGHAVKLSESNSVNSGDHHRGGAEQREQWRGDYLCWRGVAL